MKLSDVYSEYVTSNNLYDKYGIATVTLKRYRNKEGKRIVSLKDAWKLEPTVYVKRLMAESCQVYARTYK